MSDKNQNDPPAPVSFRSSTLQSLVRKGATSASVRPGVRGSTAPKAKAAAAKPKTTFRFTPSLIKTTAPKTTPAPTIKARAEEGAVTNIQNVLAQRLAASQANAARLSAGRGRGAGPQSRIVSSTLQNKLAQYENMKKRKRDAKKSRDILELSWAAEGRTDTGSIYTPISLPYVVREDLAEDSDAETSAEAKRTDVSTGEKKTQRPSIKNVDEANRNAASLFENEDADFNDINDWILVQFPSILPALDCEAMEKQKEALEDELLTEEERKKKREVRANEEKRRKAAQMVTGSIVESYIPSSFAGLPEGKMGRIVIRQSGKVQFIMGDHIFDVNSGSDCNFAQEVGCHVVANNEFFFLGRCLKRMMVTPEVQRLIQLSRGR